MPGTFTVRLIVDGTTRERPLVVRADPRDPRRRRRCSSGTHALAQLNAELSGVDTMLNRIDAELRMPYRRARKRCAHSERA